MKIFVMIFSVLTVLQSGFAQAESTVKYLLTETTLIDNVLRSTVLCEGSNHVVADIKAENGLPTPLACGPGAAMYAVIGTFFSHTLSGGTEERVAFSGHASINGHYFWGNSFSLNVDETQGRLFLESHISQSKWYRMHIEFTRK